MHVVYWTFIYQTMSEQLYVKFTVQNEKQPYTTYAIKTIIIAKNPCINRCHCLSLPLLSTFPFTPMIIVGQSHNSAVLSIVPLVNPVLSDTYICGRTQAWKECTLPWADEVWQLDRNHAIRLPSNASQSGNPTHEKLRQCKLSLQTSTHQH